MTMEELAKKAIEESNGKTFYRQIRDEWKELLTAKANIDRILGTVAPEQTVRKERSSEQR